EDSPPLRAHALARPLRCTRRVPPRRRGSEPQDPSRPYASATTSLGSCPHRAAMHRPSNQGAITNDFKLNPGPQSASSLSLSTSSVINDQGIKAIPRRLSALPQKRHSIQAAACLLCDQMHCRAKRTLTEPRLQKN